MGINQSILYQILARAARSQGQGQITYGDLSNQYRAITQDWHDPHGSWDEPLGDLNNDLDALGWPPLSVVVVLQESREPGGRFWQSSPNVPARPRNDLERTILYGQILAQVQVAPWPTEIPTEPLISK